MIENLIENTNDPLGTRITGIASLVWHDISSTIALTLGKQQPRPQSIGETDPFIYALLLHGLSEHESKGRPPEVFCKKDCS